MGAAGAYDPLIGGTTCGSLLQQLQKIWDEVGESDEERDKMLLQLEQECLDVYKRKVDQAARFRAALLQKLADSKAEFARLLGALGESSFDGMPERSSGTIKEQLEAIEPALDQLCRKKKQRIKEFAEVQSQIELIRMEIAGSLAVGEQIAPPEVNQGDLTVKMLEEFQSQLQALQAEKSDRLHKISNFVGDVHDLCAVLGLDFISTIAEAHPSLDDAVGIELKSISNSTLSKLSKLVTALQEEKKKRLARLQVLAARLTDLWNLMDTPDEERRTFDHVVCNISAAEDDVTVSGALAIHLVEEAEVEVERLDQLKASRMKEIAFKKQSELEDIYARAHVEIDSEAARRKILAIIDAGDFEPSELLVEMDNRIAEAKEEALTRKDILEKVDRWMSACEEESWLEDYSRDDNRYNASRGAHLNLKRAEKARVLVSKIPALVDALVAKARAWEEEQGTSFTYDGVPLLAMLDEYKTLRRDKEEEKRRLRDQKKFNDQLVTEQEAIFGSRPSPARQLSQKKVVGTPGRRFSSNQNGGGSMSRDGRRDKGRPVAPVNYVAICKEDVASQASSINLGASSP